MAFLSVLVMRGLLLILKIFFFMNCPNESVWKLRLLKASVAFEILIHLCPKISHLKGAVVQ